MSQPRCELLSGLDLVEAFQLCLAVFTLHDLGAMDDLKGPCSVEKLAAKHKLDTGLLSGLLEYVAVRTNILRKRGGSFHRTVDYSAETRFLLDLYCGAFGSSARKISGLLREPSLASSSVDYALRARAFSQVDHAAPRWEGQIIRQLGLSHTLDLGCGPATLLIQLAIEDPKFIGWGLDVHSEMCRLARKNIGEAGIGRRVKVVAGDSKDLRRVLPIKIRTDIRSVAACQVANEMFTSGQSQAVAWLKQIRETLPGRPLLLSDYYGRLGNGLAAGDRRTLLHDYAQLISGQGIPPPNLKSWRKIYAEAGCKLAHVIEDQQTTRFLHLVML